MQGYIFDTYSALARFLGECGMQITPLAEPKDYRSNRMRLTASKEKYKATVRDADEMPKRLGKLAKRLESSAEKMERKKGSAKGR